MIRSGSSQQANRPSPNFTSLSNMDKPEATIEKSVVHPLFEAGAPEKITLVAYHEVPHVKWFKGSKIRGMR